MSRTNDVLCNIYVNTDVYLPVTECVRLLQKPHKCIHCKNCVPLLPLISVFVAFFLNHDFMVGYFSASLVKYALGSMVAKMCLNDILKY